MSEVRLDSIRALSHGIGLGVLLPARARVIGRSEPGQPQHGASPNQSPPPILADAWQRIEQHGAPARQRFGAVVARLAFGHVLDFVIVTGVCSSIALVVSATLSPPALSPNGLTQLVARTVKWVAHFGLIEILAVIYGMIAVYWGVFRITAGRTLGAFVAVRVLRGARRTAP